MAPIPWLGSFAVPFPDGTATAMVGTHAETPQPHKNPQKGGYDLAQDSLKWDVYRIVTIVPSERICP